MKKLIAIIPLILALSSCAQNAEQAAAYRQFGMQMLSNSQQSSQGSSAGCMYNAAANSYQKCFAFDRATGRCMHFGAVCAP